MTVQFRIAESHEHAAVAQVILESYAEYGPLLPPEAWERYSQNILDVRSRMTESELLIAVEDGEIVGSATFYPHGLKRTQSEWPREWTGARLIAVLPERRGRGIGKALVEECIRRSREQGAAAFALHTTPYMQLAQGMYERMGFVRVPEFDFHPRPGLTVMAYRYDLSEGVQ